MSPFVRPFTRMAVAALCLVAADARAQARGAGPAPAPAAAGAAAPRIEHPGAARVHGYLEAFNSGEEAMARYLAANLAPEALERRAVADRLGTYRDLRGAHGRLELVRLLRAAPDALTVRVRDAHGAHLELGFQLEAGAPHRLQSLRVMMAGPDDDGAAEAVTDAGRRSEPEAVRAWVAHLDSLAARDAFSGVVLLARGDSVLVRRGFGLADRAARVANEPGTRFNIGSINKVFTQVAIARLVEQGRVDLDAPIAEYLPDYPRAVAERVTVRHLLEHRGGIGDVFGPAYEGADRSRLRTVADWIPFFRDTPLAFTPGEGRRYSNGGYVLLGAIVERASGEDYYEHIRRTIYEPLGMAATDHHPADRLPAPTAAGYRREGAEWKDNAGSRPWRGSPAGGGYSTVDDLFAFARALRDGRLVRPASLRDFPQLGPGPGGEVGMGFGGGAPGINATVELSGPYTIVVLANLDPPAASAAAERVSGWLPQTAGAPAGRRMMRGPGGSR